MIYSSNSSVSNQLTQKQNSLLLLNEEAKQSNFNDKLLLPNSTRSLKRRASLLEKSRDWARRLITLHRPRRNTIAQEKVRQTCSESKEKQDIKSVYSQESSQNYLDEDGYLSPMEIKAKIDRCSHRNSDYYQTPTKSFTNSEQQPLLNSNSSSHISQRVYRYQDPNIQQPIIIGQQQKCLPKKSFASEFQKSLSIFDYIDVDVPHDLSKQDDDNDDSLEALKYLFDDDQKRQQGNLSRRILRRSTNASSISTDSGYGDVPISSSRIIPVHLISCTLVPVNLRTTDPMHICCMTCTCRPSSSSTCLSNQQERNFTSHSQFFHQPLSHLDCTKSSISAPCACNNKYYSSTAIYPSLSVPSAMTTKSVTKADDYKDYHDKKQKQQDQKKYFRMKRASLVRLSNTNDDLSSISRWYKPYLERETVCDALQQADYGAFILRNSTTHADCYALSIKVPKFTHESNIVHYLIERIMINNTPNYRIKGTIKQFPTLLSLLIHHSVMPEILPITLNLNESSVV